jgi:HD-like signal output (HDOD) protein/CheY-like chemotaxis protein
MKSNGSERNTGLRRILFVDDEPNVLEGLQRMLRSMRHEWDMAFAEGGVAALEILDAGPCDVVVSDMRMPGMDGVRLLSEVRERYPQTVRIVLSGHSDHELILKSVGAAHQYLSKPCDADSVKETVVRAFALRDLLTNEKLQLLVSRMRSLPSVPSLYAQLLEELESPDASIERIGEIVSRDPGMTAKILQLVNSAFFGLRRHISSSADATSLLGLDTIKALALSVGVFSRFDRAQVPGFDLDALLSYSTAIGMIAREIARAEGQTEEAMDAAFTAGLLHQTGKLVLAAQLPGEYNAMLALAREEGLLAVKAERRIFGAAYPEVGAYWLGLWGLPDSIVDAVAFHHRPGQCPVKAFGPLTAVHTAIFLERQTRPAGPGADDVSPLDLNYLASLGLDGRVGAWQETCRQTIVEQT